MPLRYGKPRVHATAILYLLTPESHSALHRLKSDEVYHFCFGDPVQMLHLRSDGTGEVVILGQDLAAGQRLNTLCLGVWQGRRSYGKAAPPCRYHRGTRLEFEDFQARRRLCPRRRLSRLRRTHPGPRPGSPWSRRRQWSAPSVTAIKFGNTAEGFLIATRYSLQADRELWRADD